MALHAAGKAPQERPNCDAVRTPVCVHPKVCQRSEGVPASARAEAGGAAHKSVHRWVATALLGDKLNGCWALSVNHCSSGMLCWMSVQKSEMVRTLCVKEPVLPTSESDGRSIFERVY